MHNGSTRIAAALTLAAWSLAQVALGGARAEAADATRGKLVFQTCAACHSDKPGAIGPSLRGIYGRKSAADPDFRYSHAMMRANLTWDEADLRDYLKHPQAKVKGNRMPFGGLTDPQDIDDVVTFLKDYR